jgi:methionyl-tRNA formyltransferase
MNFGFVTCVKLGLSCIEKIYSDGYKLDLLITLNDNKSKSKSGRIYLDDFSKKNSIPLLKINHINDKEVVEALIDYQIDWLFIIGWSQICSINTIKTVKMGVIGAHPTLLPEGRGRASIPWAIIKNLTKTGVTFFNMDEGVDSGDIIAQQEILIVSNESATSLYQKVNNTHIILISDVMNKLISGNLNFTKQDVNKITYWEGRKKEDGEIKSFMSVIEVERLIRATTHPYPGAFFIQNGKKFIIWSASINKSEVETNVYIKFKDGDIILNDFDVIDISI